MGGVASGDRKRRIIFFATILHLLYHHSRGYSTKRVLFLGKVSICLLSFRERPPFRGTKGDKKAQ